MDRFWRACVMALVRKITYAIPVDILCALVLERFHDVPKARKLDSHLYGNADVHLIDDFVSRDSFFFLSFPQYLNRVSHYISV